MALGLLLGAVLLLIVLAQAVLFFNQLALLPPWACMLGYMAVVGLGLVAVGALARLIWVFVQLKATPSISPMALQEVPRRAEARQQAAEEARAGARRVEQFLRGYDISSPQVRKRLQRLRVEPATLDKLVERRHRLLEGDRTDSVSWLKRLGRAAMRELRPIADPRVEKRGACVDPLLGLMFGNVPHPSCG